MEGINTLGERLAHPGGSLAGHYVYTGLCFSFLALRSPAEFFCAADVAGHQHGLAEAKLCLLDASLCPASLCLLEQAAEKPALGAWGCCLSHQRLPVDFHVPHLF